MDEQPRDKRVTDPMRFSHSDRVHVENRVDKVATEMQTRMKLLEENVQRLQRLSKVVWFSIGLATASLAVQLFRILVLGLAGKLN